MRQTHIRLAFDYELSPVLIHQLTHGSTWAKSCERCGREIAIDT